MLTQYRQFIHNVRSNRVSREEVEWANYWIDQANVVSEKRILLIGDSTARMVRRTLAKLTKCPVDLIASSSSLHDELFVNLIDGYFKNLLYSYDYIFVQLGHHAEIEIDDGGVFRVL